MLHDLIGVPRDRLDDFLSDVDGHLILSGGIWRHSKRTASSVSLSLDKYFDEEFKKYVRAKNPKTGAFARKRIYELVEPHRHRRFVLVADVKKYFENIAYQQFTQLLTDSPELMQHSSEIKKVYFYNGYLRRGLVASPAISEVVGLRIDAIIQRLIYETGLLQSTYYSRYYDDIVISGDDTSALERLRVQLTLELKKHLSLEVNEKKTKVRLVSGTKILGLSFHGGEVTPPKSFKANLRAAEHQYRFMRENDLEEVSAKMSRVGTIYASYHRIVNSSSIDTSSLNSTINFYKDELHRLHELFRYLLQKQFEEMNS